MPTALETVIAKFTGKTSSKHRAVIKRINKLEDLRTRVMVAENQFVELAARARKAGLASSADLFEQQAEILKREREGLEKSIIELIDGLRSKHKQK